MAKNVPDSECVRLAGEFKNILSQLEDLHYEASLTMAARSELGFATQMHRAFLALENCAKLLERNEGRKDETDIP